MVGGEHSLKIAGPLLLWIGSEGVLKLFSQRMTQCLNELMSDKGVCRTAPATEGLLNILI